MKEERNLQELLEAYNTLKEEVQRVAPLAVEALDGYVDGEKGFNLSSEFTIDDKTWVNVEGDEYWAYGGHEHHHFCFPASLLFNPDLETILENSKADRLRKFQERKEREEREKQEKQDAKDKADFERLQKKFGSNGIKPVTL